MRTPPTPSEGAFFWCRILNWFLVDFNFNFKFNFRFKFLREHPQPPQGGFCICGFNGFSSNFPNSSSSSMSVLSAVENDWISWWLNCLDSRSTWQCLHLNSTTSSSSNTSSYANTPYPLGGGCCICGFNGFSSNFSNSSSSLSSYANTPNPLGGGFFLMQDFKLISISTSTSTSTSDSSSKSSSYVNTPNALGGGFFNDGS